MDFRRNNLDAAASPYLRQHAANPVWWQQWLPETLEHARAHDKVILVSVGYSTCHWCHVMAAGAFSDVGCAEVLNRDFVAIKVDREERPDIDHFLMGFLVSTTGAGGWPLNAFLTPSGDPFFAMTFAAPKARPGIPAFPAVLTGVSEFYELRKTEIGSFELPEQLLGRDRPDAADGADRTGSVPDESGLQRATGDLRNDHDEQCGGFGTSQKFPPHSALLFMLNASAGTPPAEGSSFGNATPDDSGRGLAEMVTGTLNAMMNRGLHDHLQGGFYRYCVDRNWTAPHFEKMLYDQAMLLWVYSLAARLFGNSDYGDTAAGVFRCLEETFRIGDLYAAGHDADTNHNEGATYLWTLDEIGRVLGQSDSEAFLAEYAVSEEGNFEGKNHLIRTRSSEGRDSGGTPRSRQADPDSLRTAEARLLEIRRERPQPFRDEKLLTAWNALAACGLLSAHRHLGLPDALGRAEEIARTLVGAMTGDGRLPHDAANPAGANEFLTDYAALLLLLVMLGEETNEFDEITPIVAGRVRRFRKDGRWIESENEDFRTVAAQSFDQPTPSGVALAEEALLRLQVRGHEMYESRPVRNPLAHGFGGLTSLLSQGLIHVVESPEPLLWADIPANSVQIRGPMTTTCYGGLCTPGLPGQPYGGQNQ